jgi:hypothetical protein
MPSEVSTQGLTMYRTEQSFKSKFQFNRMGEHYCLIDKQ